MKRLLYGAAIALAAACANNTGPVAGSLTVTLTTPNSGNDGAILLSVSGPASLTGASAASGLRLFAPATLGSVNRFVLTGTLNAGAILTLQVPDVNQVGSYTATVQQVAAPNYQLRSLTGYSLKVSQ